MAEATKPDLLHTPLRIGGATIRNRLYRAPGARGRGRRRRRRRHVRQALRRERPPRRRPDHPGLVVHLPGGTDVAGHDARRHPGEGAAPGADGRRRPRRGRGDLPADRPRRPVLHGGVARAVRLAADRTAPGRRSPPLVPQAGVRRGARPRDDDRRGPRHGRASTARSRRGRGRRATTACSSGRPTPSCSTSSSRRSTTRRDDEFGGSAREPGARCSASSARRSPSGRATTTRAR